MKALLLIFVSLTFLYSQDMDALLSSYATESELSKKTKDESAGNLIIYTRDDLERMQVESLKDILKSLRFFSYAENRVGQTDIFNSDPAIFYSQTVRIYLNDTELLVPLTGSGLGMFGNMEMDFINHVEIYEGFPSLDIGFAPSTVVIRLYTKTSEHDDGARVKAQYGSYGSNKENIYYIGENDDLAYSFYANRSDDKKETYHKNGETLRKDKRTERFYASVNNDNHKLELHVQKVSGDAFLGTIIGMNGAVPHNSEIESQFVNIATDSKFMNDTLELHLSYVDEEEKLESNYNNPVTIFRPPTSLIPIDYVEQNIYQEAFTSSLKKNITLDSHNISLGVKYRYKHFDVDDHILSYSSIPLPIPTTKSYNRQDVYSAFVQDNISFGDNHLLTLSTSYQYYKRNQDAKDIDTTQLRFGYTYTNNRWVSKTFISRQEFAPQAYMSISSGFGNIDLEPDSYTSIYQEISYSTSKTIYKTVFGAGFNEDIPVFNEQGKTINSDKRVKGYFGALEYTYKFRDKDKLELQANFLHIDSPYYLYPSTTRYHYVARVLNTVGKFDIFNELVVHSGFSNSDTGYDYSAGVKYEANKNLHISLKGENLFDDSLDWNYYNQINPINGQTDNVVVPTIERRFLISMEYLF